MFENLTDRLSQTLRHVTGKAKLTEDNIKDTLREVRMALLEADVALPVVKDFVAAVKERAVGTEVSRSLTPGQAFVKIVQAELESLMGAANEDLVLNVTPPAVVLMAGLQGAGKTTTTAKLAKHLIEKRKADGADDLTPFVLERHARDHEGLAVGLHDVEQDRLPRGHHLAHQAARDDFLDFPADGVGRRFRPQGGRITLVDPDDTRVAVDDHGSLAKTLEAFEQRRHRKTADALVIAHSRMTEPTRGRNTAHTTTTTLSQTEQWKESAARLSRRPPSVPPHGCLGPSPNGYWPQKSPEFRFQHAVTRYLAYVRRYGRAAEVYLRCVRRYFEEA